jgi:RimJ/RimL family protein N-acetyltransferase
VRAGERRPVGTVALSDPDWERRSAELGFWVVPAERDEGLATRAAALVLGWAFRELRFRELALTIEPGNEASFAVARKLGAEPTGEILTEQLRGEEYRLERWVLRP